MNYDSSLYEVDKTAVRRTLGTQRYYPLPRYHHMSLTFTLETAYSHTNAHQACHWPALYFYVPYTIYNIYNNQILTSNI